MEKLDIISDDFDFRIRIEIMRKITVNIFMTLHSFQTEKLLIKSIRWRHPTSFARYETQIKIAYALRRTSQRHSYQ